MCKKGQEQLPVPTLQTRITCIQVKNNHPFPCFGNRLKIAEHGNPDGVYLLAKEILEDRMEHHEEVYLILLNQASKILGVALVSRGSVNKTVVDIKIIFQHIILSNSSRIILFHNHPSGNCKPSKADDELTKNITQLSSLAGVDFIDHLIVSDDDYYSYSNECRYDVLKPQSMMNNLSPFLEKEEIILPNPL